MKANAWNKSRITPTITNFLVLIFSMIAPAIAKEVSGVKMSHGARNKQKRGLERDENAASTASRKAKLGPLHTALLLPFNFEGGKRGGKKKNRNHMTK